MNPQRLNGMLVQYLKGHMLGNMVLMSRLDLSRVCLYMQSERTVVISIIQAKCFLHESLAACYQVGDLVCVMPQIIAFFVI